MMITTTTTATTNDGATTTNTTNTTTTSLVADILSEAIAAADGRTADNSPTNTYVRKLFARRIPVPTNPASGPLIRLILVDTATQAHARVLTTLAFIDVRRADAPAILQHATAAATATAATATATTTTTSTDNPNQHNTAARAILKAVRKTIRIERRAAKAARRAVALAAHLLDRLDNNVATTSTTVKEEEDDDDDEEEEEIMASP